MIQNPYTSGFADDEDEQPQTWNPLVKKYIQDKYFGGGGSDQVVAPQPTQPLQNPYDDASRQKILDENNQYDTGGAIAGALASLGAAFQGKDSVSAGMNIVNQRNKDRENRLTEFDKGRANKIQEDDLARKKVIQSREDEQYSKDNDPNSEYAKSLQALGKKYTSSIDYTGKTPAEMMKILPTLEKTYSVDEDRRKRQDALNLKRETELAKKNEGVTEGRKALDKDYAKDYNDWTSTGRSALEKNIERLKKARELLSKPDSDLTGSIRGLLPDKIRNITNEPAIATRDDVRAAAQGALKATLGSQFTEREGERIMNQAYNEQLSPQANIEKINAAIKELETNRDNNDRKAAYFQQKGSLTGLDNTAVASQPKEKTIVKKQMNPKTGQVRVVYSDGTTEIINSVAGGQ